jgi:hypothetical protein
MADFTSSRAFRVADPGPRARHDHRARLRPRHAILHPPLPEADGMRGACVHTDSWLYRLLVALSGMTLVLVVVYIVVIQDNRSVQAEINQRQQFINQSIQLGRINDALIRALATTAVSNKDDKLRDLLAQNGITINPTTGAPEREAAPAAAAPAAAGR